MPTYGYLLPTRDTVINSETAAELSAATQSEVIGLARRAEAVGLDAVWIGDSVTAKPRHEPLTTLAAIASVTETVELGSAVYLPTLRHVINVAHATATVDQISGGRLQLGVGVGRGDEVRREYEQLGVPFGERGALLNETLDALGELWTGGPVTYDGDYFTFEEASIGFAPVRQPPIHVASSVFHPEKGFPRSIRERIQEYGDGWMPTGIKPEYYAEGIAYFRDLVEEAGRDPDDVIAACYVDVVIADTHEEAIEEAREYLLEYYPGWGDLSDADIEKRGGFGPPDHVREQLRAYEECGVEQFVCRFPSTRQAEHVEAFADLLD